ncbi:carbohydrate ABC transporter permease [Kineothrix sp. MB12-C1]|uniref:carbohydrate ABC transporter permease n=1 Tax=Kineothrix sp. MB12-C1 TaxID=3070215 RepID=UPI0027D2710D|nr:sugar ABC transporter permease [Kineothrix sp. MB12-C1]WMC93638.1 sugar ABC transporter permease [Kineothrix sp. MB12-C1]
MQKSEKKKKLNITPYLFIAPHVIIFIIFFLVPMFYGIYASFTKWDLFTPPTFVGLKNYSVFLTDTESVFYRQFWNGLKNTVIFVLICVPFQLAIPLVMALLLNKRPRGRNIFQGIFYMPTLFSITSVTLTWLFIFNRSLGLFNKLFGTDINWYASQPWAWITIVATTIWWGIGGNLIIYVAALSGIDKSILEAADLDGASGWKRFRYIIVPSIQFPLVYTLIVSVIAQFNVYGQPLMLTAGGPSESTFVLIMYIRNLAFGTGKSVAGMASAMSTCLGIIIGSVAVAQLILMRKNSD